MESKHLDGSLAPDRNSARGEKPTETQTTSGTIAPGTKGASPCCHGLRAVPSSSYGVSGILGEIDDIRAHGKDERIGIEAFFEGREFLDRLTRTLAGGQ